MTCNTLSTVTQASYYEIRCKSEAVAVERRLQSNRTNSTFGHLGGRGMTQLAKKEVHPSGNMAGLRVHTISGSLAECSLLLLFQLKMCFMFISYSS